MKKILLLIIAAVICCNISSIAQSDHFTFQGIPINGTISEFHNKIVNKGWKLKYDAKKKKYKKTSTEAIYDGTFVGEKAELKVEAANNTVLSCMVCFKKNYINYGALKTAFQILDERIRDKYNLSPESNMGSGDNNIYMIDGCGMINLFTVVIYDEDVYKLRLLYGDLQNISQKLDKEDEDL